MQRFFAIGEQSAQKGVEGQGLGKAAPETDGRAVPFPEGFQALQTEPLGDSRVIAALGMGVQGRITSYNVCYTKLLRGANATRG